MGRGDDREDYLVVQLQDVTLLRQIADAREYHNIGMLLDRDWTWERIALAVGVSAAELQDRWKRAADRLDYL